MAEMRDLCTIEQAVLLLDEWITAYLELEGDIARLNHAWQVRCRALEFENHRLYALDCERWLAEETERMANEEASPVEEGDPFGG